MTDEIIKQPTRARRGTRESDQTSGSKIVATLVVPVDLKDVTWPSLKVWEPLETWQKEEAEKAWEEWEEAEKAWEGWKAGPHKIHAGSRLPVGDQRCYRVGLEGHECVGQFKVECVELARPDDRTHWGLIHLSTDKLDLESLRARADELWFYVRLRKDDTNGVAEIAKLLSPAQPDIRTNSRASAVILLLGDTVDWGSKGNRLAEVLGIEPLTFVLTSNYDRNVSRAKRSPGTFDYCWARRICHQSV